MRTLLRVTLFFQLIVFAGSMSAYAQLPAEDHVVELGVMFWKPSPELILSTDALAATSLGEVDFVEDLGVEEKYFPEFRATIGRTHKFRASLVTFDYHAETTFTRTIVFQGRTFNIGVPATSDIKWDLYKFGYEWDFVSGEGGFFGFIADVKYNKVRASIDSPVLSTAATADVSAPVPSVGVIGRGYLAPALSITGEFTGLKLSRDDDEGKTLDFDVYGTLTFGRNVGVQAGYRSVILEYTVDEDIGDLKMEGLYVGALVRF